MSCTSLLLVLSWQENCALLHLRNVSELWLLHMRQQLDPSNMTLLLRRPIHPSDYVDRRVSWCRTAYFFSNFNIWKRNEFWKPIIFDLLRTFKEKGWAKWTLTLPLHFRQMRDHRHWKMAPSPTCEDVWNIKEPSWVILLWGHAFGAVKNNNNKNILPRQHH